MKPNCYVCGRVIQKDALYIGQDLYRHHSSCEPGNKRWMEIQKARPAKLRSELYPYFLVGYEARQARLAQLKNIGDAPIKMVQFTTRKP